MGKTRVGVILRESVGGNKSTSKSESLVELTQKYHAFCKKLNAMIQSLRDQNNAMIQMDQARNMVVQNFAALTKGTPLWECVGCMPGAGRPADSVCSFASIYDGLSAKSKGYSTKYQQFLIEYAAEWQTVVTTRINAGIKTADLLRRDLDHYQKKVESLRLQVNQTMAKGKQVAGPTQERLQRNEEKFMAAKQSYNKVAFDLCVLLEEVCERSWRDLHPLLIKAAQFDQTTSQDQSQVLGKLSAVVQQLKAVGTTNGISPQPRLKDLANLNPELLSTKPGGVAGAQFSLEGGGGATSPTSTNSTNGALSPTASLTGGGAGGGSFDHQQGSNNLALPPGSVGAQGMGGFPVQVGNSSTGGGGGSVGGLPPQPPPQSTSSSALTTSSMPDLMSNNQNQHSSSLLSGGNAPSSASFTGGAAPTSSFASAPTSSTSQFEPPSTLSMLSLSQASAPPPTMEDIYSANHHAQSQAAAPTATMTPRSAPPSGNGGYLPPLSASSYQRQPSAGAYSDSGSATGGYYGAPTPPAAAPPMAAPPPPPSMPPPPPPAGYLPAPPASAPNLGMTMYGQQQQPPPQASPYAPPMPQQQQQQPPQHMMYGGGGGMPLSTSQPNIMGTPNGGTIQQGHPAPNYRI